MSVPAQAYVVRIRHGWYAGEDGFQAEGLSRAWRMEKLDAEAVAGSWERAGYGTVSVVRIVKKAAHAPEAWAMTLLERRREELRELIDVALHRAEKLRKCLDGGYADLTDRVRSLASAATDARLIAAKVDDLRDIEEYGPRGGR